MKRQKVIITDSEYDINRLIDNGWTVVSIIAQHVATSTERVSYGKFCILLEKLEK